jgi:hypothetical protein
MPVPARQDSNHQDDDFAVEVGRSRAKTPTRKRRSAWVPRSRMTATASPAGRRAMAATKRRRIGGSRRPRSCSAWRVYRTDLPESAAHSMPGDCFSSSAEIDEDPRMLCVEPSKRLHLIVQRSFGWHMIEHPRNQINGCIG